MSTENRKITFDDSNEYFVSAQEEVIKIKNSIDSAVGFLNGEINALNNLSSVSPVGFEHDETIHWKTDFSLISMAWDTIMTNANNIREIGDLINKGFSSELEKFFQSYNDFLGFIGQVALGKNSVSLLTGNSVLSSVDYFNILNDGYTVQGYTKIIDSNGDETVLVSAHGGKKDNSKMYMYDAKTGKLKGIMEFNYAEHVGGITYDSENGILWVAGDDGKVHSYNYKRIEEDMKDNKTNHSNTLDFSDLSSKYYEIPNNIQIKDLVSSIDHHQDGMDSIYFYDGKLYSCTYGKKGELIETNIKVTKDRYGKVSIHDESKVVGTLNGATQGLAVYEENGKTYVITASSASYATSKSRLTKWELDSNGNLKDEPVGFKYIDHTGLEGIEVEDGYVKGIFERGWGMFDQNQTTEVLADASEMNDSPDWVVDNLLSFGGGFWDAKSGDHAAWDAVNSIVGAVNPGVQAAKVAKTVRNVLGN